MSDNLRKVILYIASTMDGFIADKNGGVDFLNKYNKKGEDYGYKKFLNSVDTLIMGNNTYKQIQKFGKFPYEGKKCFVITRDNNLLADENVRYLSGNLVKFFRDLKKSKGKSIWLVGGAETVGLFLNNQLLDEIILTMAPEFLGEGIQLFQYCNRKINMDLKSVKHFKQGPVQVKYKILS